MWPAKRFAKPADRTLFVAIGARRIDCGVMTGEGSRAQWIQGSLLSVPIDTADGVAAPAQALIAAIARVPTPADWAVDQVRVLVADSWLAVATVPWNASAQQAAAAQGYARTQLADAGFEVEPNDTLKLDDAPFGVPRLAIAYPAVLLSALSQLAIGLRARLSSVLPLSMAAWALAQRAPGTRPRALAVLEAGLMMFVLGARDGRPGLSDVSVRSDASGLESDDQRLLQAWRRLCLRDPQWEAVAPLAVLHLAGSGEPMLQANPFFAGVELPGRGVPVTAPAGLRLAATARLLHHPLDALPNRPALTPWRRMVFGAATLLAGVVVVQAVRAHLAVQSLTSKLDAATAVAQPVPRPASWSREDLARVQAVNVAIRELNLPIAPILRAVQPPVDIHVAVLSVDAAGGASGTKGASVKIVAEARNGVEMARYVAFVSERKPFTGAYLTRHEIDQAAADQPYRFTVEALWSE